MELIEHFYSLKEINLFLNFLDLCIKSETDGEVKKGITELFNYVMESYKYQKEYNNYVVEYNIYQLNFIQYLMQIELNIFENELKTYEYIK